MSTLFGFGWYEDDMCEEKTAEALERLNHPTTGVYKNRLTYTAPMAFETTGRRLDRLIAHIEAKRPSGIIEVVLQENNPDKPYNSSTQCQRRYREAALLERGFKHVTRTKNSNSNNFINVYHRISAECERIVFEEEGGSKEVSLR
jgi:hypothetical protein